jgi:casein kinase II subunit beta
MLIDVSARSWFINIDDYFLQSSVSYYNLQKKVLHFHLASAVVRCDPLDISILTRGQISRLGQSVLRLYGLLHQRFLITDDGARKLQRKITAGVYGVCPRVMCRGARLLPYGATIELDQDRVKCWCPKCHDLYESTSDLDAGFFGPDVPVMYCKILGLPLRFQVASSLLEAYRDDRKEVPKIEKRLVRWGE